MLLIRNAQLPILAEHLVVAYREQAYEFVEREYPGEIERRGEHGVRALIESALQRGQRYRLTSGREVTTLLALMIVFGEDFDERPERRQLLSSSLESGEKMRVLIDQMKLEAKENRKRRRGAR